MTITPSLQELLRHSAATLAVALDLDSRGARLEAQVLLGHALQRSRAWLIAHDGDTLDPVQVHAFATLFERRLLGEPIAYILGRREFYGLDITVSPAVLIPRPESELLVELALTHLPENRTSSVLDLGTGSGAIALAIAKYRPRAEIVAVDFSAAALETAQENAHRLGIANIRFLRGVWFDTLPALKKFDVIVSNPPYIAADDPHLSQGDLRFEPRTALISGVRGLDDLRKIIAGAPSYLASGGRLLFEHGYDQAPACHALLRQSGFSDISSNKDLAGIERVTSGQRQYTSRG